MYKSLFLVPDVHKGGVERRKKFLHFPEEYIPYGKTVPLAGLLVQFNQPVVFHQRDVNFCRRYVDNQILFRLFGLHEEIAMVFDMKKGPSGLPVSPFLSANC